MHVATFSRDIIDMGLAIDLIEPTNRENRRGIEELISALRLEIILLINKDHMRIRTLLSGCSFTKTIISRITSIIIINSLMLVHLPLLQDPTVNSTWKECSHIPDIQGRSLVL